jgi:Ca-activated chloride channel family protein
MTFEDPIWLAIAPLIGLLSLALVLLGWRQRAHLLRRFAAARLLERLTEKASTKRRLLKSALIVAAMVLLGLALARPQYGVEWSERKARGLDIVFALDSSRSMLATDLRPTRLERGKLAILDLIDRLESDRIGLVAFAGQAFLQTPPTLDYAAFRESLKATDPSILSRGGSDLGRAVQEASKAFPSANNVKVVVLLTDGEDLGGRALDAARTAAENGIQIFTIGIGTPQGEYLRVRNEQGIEEFVRDNDGQPVRSQLDESTLQQIAKITGGSYSRLDGRSLDTLYDSVLATLPREERESELQEVRIERFQWLLAAALTFLVLEILIRSRRPRASGAAQASLLLLPLLLVSPTPTEAAPYNEAHIALTEGDYAKANELYTEAMRQTNDRALQRDALYNMGHATYQQGRSAYEQGDVEAARKDIHSAEKLFASALELDPGDDAIRQDLERTRKVREQIETFLEQQENQQQQEQQESEQSGEQKDGESEDSQNQGQPDSEQNNESEQSEQESGESGEQPQDQQGQSGQEQPQHNQSEGEQPQTGQGESGEQQGQADESQEQGSPSEANGQGSESTSDPSERPDQPPGASQSEGGEPNEEPSAEPAPGESAEEATGESTEPVPQVGEPEEARTGEESGSAAAADPSAAQVDGMTIKDAQALLDSLRGKEEILPFAKPAPGRGRPLQDW